MVQGIACRPIRAKESGGLSHLCWEPDCAPQSISQPHEAVEQEEPVVLPMSSEPLGQSLSLDFSRRPASDSPAALALFLPDVPAEQRMESVSGRFYGPAFPGVLCSPRSVCVRNPQGREPAQTAFSIQ